MSAAIDLEVWGGHECTLNRVGDVYRDQTVMSGHEMRDDDLDQFADLGLRALRYPVLWERVAPESAEVCDWRWSDGRLRRIDALGMRVIAGLMHHGSGPRYAGIMSTAFAPGLAAHARNVAQRYPWIQDWTPVNEPVTTARFVGLYGHWHPHMRQERAFWLALLNQVDATRLAMKEVRRVNASARLVQTEDLGRTYATPALRTQEEYDNARRWMGWDLLCGRVTRDHYFWARLEALGFGERLRAIADDPSPPDVLGVNHYLTSDRFLDDRWELYPAHRRGGNDERAFADVEAVRTLDDPPPQGLDGALQEAWSRYGVTLAITELHNACTREEQVRWFAEGWQTAHRLRNQGVDVAAVTAWSLLGAYDWNSLLTRSEMHYECGVFDVSSGRPRPTMLAAHIKQLTTAVSAPQVQGRGWWRRGGRLEFRLRGDHAAPAELSTASAGRILIIGAAGTLGRALAATCAMRDVPYIATTRAQLSLSDSDAIARCLDRWEPHAVVNAAGWVDVDGAEAQRAACHQANTEGPGLLARACAARNIRLTTFSSDLVFDGAAERPYLETDTVNALNTYGRSKIAAEALVLGHDPQALIIRTAAFFSERDPYNFAAWTVRELSAGRRVRCAADVVVSPTYVPALAHAVLNLVQDGCHGIWHLANGGAVSWFEFARSIADIVGLDRTLVTPVLAAEMGWLAPRPRFSPLASSRGVLMRPLQSDLALFAAMQSGVPQERAA